MVIVRTGSRSEIATPHRMGVTVYSRTRTTVARRSPRRSRRRQGRAGIAAQLAIAISGQPPDHEPVVGPVKCRGDGDQAQGQQRAVFPVLVMEADLVEVDAQDGTTARCWPW